MESDISRHIWDTKYRFKINGQLVDESLTDTWKRAARSLALVENNDRSHWERLFYRQLIDFKFIPGGRILAGAGTDRNVTLFNCFVMGLIEDSIPSIFDNLKEGALTMQYGGGVGYDFSALRPKGSPARSTNNISSGPVSFMKVWDAMCGTMLSTGARRGAMMGTLRCDHPDILSFIEAKKEPNVLTNFNLSVLITDEFMESVEHNAEWPLVFPIDEEDDKHCPGEYITFRLWTGSKQPVPCCIIKRIKARKIWDALMKSNYENAEPGVLFIDRINQMNNLNYCEQISCTNPCGEVPLPPYGACNLGSLNLTQFIREPFTEEAFLDLEAISETTSIAVRMLDNVTDLSRFPIKEQQMKAKQSRRIGLGITGLADALAMLGLRYDSQKGRNAAASAMREICHTAYRASIILAQEKGPFPCLDTDAYLKSPFVQSLPTPLQKRISKYGIRNSHLLSIAPTGSISLLAHNVSSGLEPIFDYEFSRNILNSDGSKAKYKVADYAYSKWIELFGTNRDLPDVFIKATELSPEDHLAMQAALQQYVDNSISKTINIPEDYSFNDFKNIYEQAYGMGLKGCTTFRPNTTTGALLQSDSADKQVHCCSLERESD